MVNWSQWQIIYINLIKYTTFKLIFPAILQVGGKIRG